MRSCVARCWTPSPAGSKRLSPGTERKRPARRPAAGRRRGAGNTPRRRGDLAATSVGADVLGGALEPSLLGVDERARRLPDAGLRRLRERIRGAVVRDVDADADVV